jgi:hypothetical protein
MLPYFFLERRDRIDGLGPDLDGYRGDPTRPYGDLLRIDRRASASGPPTGRTDR